MTRYYYFSLGSLPPSGHGALQCCVMSYLAIWHLLIAFLGFVPYLPLASSALKTKLLICLWFFILQSVCFSDIYYIYFHYILGVWEVWLLFKLSRWRIRVQGHEGPGFPLALCSQLAVFRICVWMFFPPEVLALHVQCFMPSKYSSCYWFWLQVWLFQSSVNQNPRSRLRYTESTK